MGAFAGESKQLHDSSVDTRGSEIQPEWPLLADVHREFMPTSLGSLEPSAEGYPGAQISMTALLKSVSNTDFR